MLHFILTDDESVRPVVALACSLARQNSAGLCEKKESVNVFCKVSPVVEIWSLFVRDLEEEGVSRSTDGSKYLDC